VTEHEKGCTHKAGHNRRKKHKRGKKKGKKEKKRIKKANLAAAKLKHGNTWSVSGVDRRLEKQARKQTKLKDSRSEENEIEGFARRVQPQETEVQDEEGRLAALEANLVGAEEGAEHEEAEQEQEQEQEEAEQEREAEQENAEQEDGTDEDHAVAVPLEASMEARRGNGRGRDGSKQRREAEWADKLEHRREEIAHLSLLQRSSAAAFEAEERAQAILLGRRAGLLPTELAHACAECRAWVPRRSRYTCRQIMRHRAPDWNAKKWAQPAGAGVGAGAGAEDGNSCQEVGGTEQAAESPAERPEDTHEEREDGANGGSDAEEEGVQGQQRQGKEETEREREEEREAERRRYNSLVAETYLLVQRALQSGPLQRSKPADFKRCKRPAEVSMAALELLCTIVPPAEHAAERSAPGSDMAAPVVVPQVRWSAKQAQQLRRWREGATKAAATKAAVSLAAAAE
jgi:hypothetical protein